MKWLFVIMLLAAACGFAIAVQALPWWHVGEAELSPIRSRNCFGQACRTGGLSWVGASQLWMQAGVATFAAGLISALISVIAAAALAAKRSPVLVANMLIVSFITSVLVAGYFISKMPLPGAQMQLGIAAFLVSAVVILVSAVFIHVRGRRLAKTSL